MYEQHQQLQAQTAQLQATQAQLHATQAHHIQVQQAHLAGGPPGYAPHAAPPNPYAHPAPGMYAMHQQQHGYMAAPGYPGHAAMLPPGSPPMAMHPPGYAAAPATPAQGADGKDRIKCSHILIKHKDSRNPVSHRSKVYACFS